LFQGLVIPAQAGIQFFWHEINGTPKSCLTRKKKDLDPSLRWDDRAATAETEFEHRNTEDGLTKKVWGTGKTGIFESQKILPLKVKAVRHKYP
jgi:hypothetical protein